MAAFFAKPMQKTSDIFQNPRKKTLTFFTKTMQKTSDFFIKTLRRCDFIQIKVHLLWRRNHGTYEAQLWHLGCANTALIFNIEKT